MVSNIVHVHPYLGKMHIWTNMFKRGWFNHQLPGFYVFQRQNHKLFLVFHVSPPKRPWNPWALANTLVAGGFYLFVPFQTLRWRMKMTIQELTIKYWPPTLTCFFPGWVLGGKEWITHTVNIQFFWDLYKLCQVFLRTTYNQFFETFTSCVKCFYILKPI